MDWSAVLSLSGALGALISVLALRRNRTLFYVAGWSITGLSACAVCVSVAVPWLLAPAAAAWCLFSLVLFFASLRNNFPGNSGMPGMEAGLASLTLLAVFLNPPLAYEFVFKLIEPRECSDDIVQVRTVLPLPDEQPELYESIAALDDGSFVVTAATRGELLTVSKNGETSILAKLPTGPFDLGAFNGMLGGVVEGRDKAIYTLVLATEPQNRGLWRVDRSGNSSLWSGLPMQASGNGLALDHQGNFYIADSALGMVWKIKPEGGPPSRWYEGSLTGAGIDSRLPTANGIKVSQSSVYVSNTRQKRIIRIQIRNDSSAGKATVMDEGIPADDFAIDNSGRLYLTTHPFNTVVRLQPGEPCAVIADVSSGIAGPTAAVFGAVPGDHSILYVLNDGGYSRPVKGGKPSIIALEIN